MNDQDRRQRGEELAALNETPVATDEADEEQLQLLRRWARRGRQTVPTEAPPAVEQAAAAEPKKETEEVDLETARKLFAELSQAKFKDDDGQDSPVPFHYPVDGCYDRAHVMSSILTAKGFAHQKVFAVSKTKGGSGALRVPTPYAGDVETGQQPAVDWWYHVAPIIKVRDAKDQVIEMVMDPSMTDRPIAISKWTGMMSQATFRHMTAEEVQQMGVERKAQNERATRYPNDLPLVFTTDRTVYGPNDAELTTHSPARAEERHEGQRPTMTQYAQSSQVHELAAALRNELASMPVDLDRIISAIEAATPVARHELLELFPNLCDEISQRALTCHADRHRLDGALRS